MLASNSLLLPGFGLEQYRVRIPWQRGLTYHSSALFGYRTKRGATQHLIHRLDQQGEVGAAELVSQLGGIAEVARDLAYRLYSTCERKKWAQEAIAYNSLVVAWPELSKIARSTAPKNKVFQVDLF